MTEFGVVRVLVWNTALSAAYMSGLSGVLALNRRTINIAKRTFRDVCRRKRIGWVRQSRFKLGYIGAERHPSADAVVFNFSLAEENC